MTITAPDLRLYSPALGNAAPVHVYGVDFSGVDYHHTIAKTGGYWQAEFTLTDGPLEQIFYEYLGFHFIERAGGQTTFEGLIYEMELSAGGSKRRRSLDDLWNYVTAKYTDSAGSVQTTAAAQNQQSVVRYGRREYLLLLNNFLADAAAGRRDTWLTEHGTPWARATGRAADLKSSLTVTVCGYAFTANWRYITAGDGTAGNLSDWIDLIARTDCTDYLLPGAIDANTYQVTKSANMPTRCWDEIAKKAALGDATYQPWRVYVDNGRRLHFRQIDKTPMYYLIRGTLYTSASGRTEVNPWQVKPGVVRDLSYPVRKIEKSSWLADARDFYMSEVQCGTGAGLTWKTEYTDESDIAAAQAEYEARLSGGGAGASGGSKPRLNWKRKLKIKEGTPEWEKASKASYAEKQDMIQDWRDEKHKKG